KAALLEVRGSRVRPGLDDKVLAAWNGLAIRAFAEAGAALEDERLLHLAAGCARFIMENLVVDGTLMRSWRDGRTSVPGFLDDHAGLAVGLFTLFAATGEVRWYHEAMGRVGRLDEFANPDGGFYSTSATGEQLVKRPADFTDNPLPSGNALAAEALMMASLYTGGRKEREASTAALGAVGLLAERYSSMVGHHLAVAHAWLDPREVAIVGDDWRELARVYWKRYRPGIVLAVSRAGSEEVPLLAERWDGTTRAFVCRGFICDLPTTDPAVLAAQLA
ncbi:MAG TPA: N-acylglucosamine 2-epimerase, partial [Acidimicrobiia bacterium]